MVYFMWWELAANDIPCIMNSHTYFVVQIEVWTEKWLVLFILIYFSLIVKQALFAYVNHAQICSWNQPVLSNEGKISCSRKQLEPLMGLELTTDRRDIHNATPPIRETVVTIYDIRMLLQQISILLSKYTFRKYTFQTFRQHHLMR